MLGTNAKTGKAISGIDNLRQRIRDVILTPLLSRCQRRNYGSVVPSLIDAPINQMTLAQIYYGVAIAVVQWSPDFTLQQGTCTNSTPGKIVLSLAGYDTEGSPILIDGLTLS